MNIDDKIGIALVCACVLGACDNDGIEDTLNGVENRAIARNEPLNLRALSPEILYMKLSINGIERERRLPLPIGDMEAQIDLIDTETDSVAGNIASVSVNFYLEVEGRETIVVATSNTQKVEFDSTGAGSLSGGAYTYFDQDDDQLSDLFEIENSSLYSDIDMDGRPAYLDDDTDNDGTIDGLDLTPYGEIRLGTFDDPPDDEERNVPLFLRLGISGWEGPDEVEIESILGSAGDIQRLAQIRADIPAALIDFWPFAHPSRALPSSRWGAVSIASGVCGDTFGGVSSLVVNSPRGVYGFFRLISSAGVLLPLVSGEIFDLSQFMVEPPATIDGALQFLLIPDGSEGWVELSTGPNFEGDRCSINLRRLL